MRPELKSKIETLEKLCAERGWTVGVAESCTGGRISAGIAAYPGASRFFLGGVTSYARQVKVDLLKVPLTTIQSFGEVSVPTATAMAVGARKCLKSDWSVSVTGIAGPSGGTPEKPVGFVCFAVSGPSLESTACKQFPASGGREDIQQQAADFAIDFLLNAMK